MKSILRILVIETFAIFVAFRTASGLEFQTPVEGIIMTGVALAIASKLIKPLINVLVLPLTLATLGLFRFVSSAITLYIVDLALPQFRVASFNFPGLTSNYIDLPPISFSEGPLSYLAFAILIAFISSFVRWLRK